MQKEGWVGMPWYGHVALTGGADDNEEILAAREIDGQGGEGLVDLLLVDASLRPRTVHAQ